MFLEDCMLEAEIHEYFRREIQEAGYAGCTFRRSFNTVEITVRVAEPALVQGDNHERIHQIEAVIAQRLSLPLNNVTIFCDKIIARGLAAEVLADQLKLKIEKQTPIRQAAMFVIKSALRAGAAGCEVAISGKLRQQRANCQKYRDGQIISAGKPGKDFIDRAVRGIPLKQGIIGIEIKVYNPKMKDQFGRQLVMPDKVEINE
ncbi:Ribosomal_protein S3 [Hexamita inflata]|uniref:40S ribosomal protein S3 n=1 Tax=Hexamita inflata TaxID=28002 RepID=A0AA86TS86_9EUKA|nr:Ribosomal protein S3 [Hexamita inflata]